MCRIFVFYLQQQWFLLLLTFFVLCIHSSPQNVLDVGASRWMFTWYWLYSNQWLKMPAIIYQTTQLMHSTMYKEITLPNIKVMYYIRNWYILLSDAFPSSLPLRHHIDSNIGLPLATVAYWVIRDNLARVKSIYR